MKVAYKTQKGKARQNNEDCLFIDEKSGLFIVADGMGGHQAGEIASKITTRAIAHSIKNAINYTPYRPKIPTLIKTAVQKANEEINKRSLQSINLNGMGSTVVLAIKYKKRIYIANVGDSRAYLIRKGAIKQLSRDHSLVSQLLVSGEITEEKAITHPMRHVITKALGREEKITPFITSTPWQKGDYFLLCSDGLTDSLRDEEIKNIILFTEDPAKICPRLINSALHKDGRDDITVIVFLLENDD